MSLGNLTDLIRIKQSIGAEFGQHLYFVIPNSNGAKENEEIGT